MPATSTDMVGKGKTAKYSSPKRGVVYGAECDSGAYAAEGEYSAHSPSRKSTPRYSYTCTNFPFNEGDEVVLVEDLNRYSKGAIAQVNRVSPGYVWVNFKGETILAKCKLSHFPFEKVSQRQDEVQPEQIKPVPDGQLDILSVENKSETALLPPNPEDEFETFAVYDFLSKAKEAVDYIVIAIEAGLTVPVARQALRKLEDSGLVECVDEKEGTWKALECLNSSEESENLGSQRSALQGESEADILQDESAPPFRQPLPSNGYSTWTPSSGDRVKLQRQVRDYPKFTIGTVTTLLSGQSVCVRMDQDGGVYPVAITDLIFLGDKQLSIEGLFENEEDLAPGGASAICSVTFSQISTPTLKSSHPLEKSYPLEKSGSDEHFISYPLEKSPSPFPEEGLLTPEFNSEPSSSALTHEELLSENEPLFKVRDCVLIIKEQRQGIITRVNQGQIEPYYSVESGGEIWEFYQSELSLVKSAGRKPASGTLYPYIAHRKNKKGINKEYTYWAYSYEVRDPETGQWKSLKKSVPKRMKQRVKDAIAQQRPVAYILEILAGKR